MVSLILDRKSRVPLSAIHISARGLGEVVFFTFFSSLLGR